MSKFIAVSENTFEDKQYNLRYHFQKLLNAEASACNKLNSFSSESLENDFKFSIGQYCADTWIPVNEQEGKVGQSLEYKFFFDQIKKHSNNDNCYCFDYHGGHVMFFALNEKDLIARFQKCTDEMMKEFAYQLLNVSRKND